MINEKCEREVEGMYCSKKFADWMLNKNETALDFPALSYYKLIRLFSRTNYNEFFREEERKGNEFFYNIVDEENSISLSRSYELVFLPYEADIQKSLHSTSWREKAVPQVVDWFIFGYRILQTRGCMPGTPEEAFSSECYTMKYLVDELLLKADLFSKYIDRKKFWPVVDMILSRENYSLRDNPFSENSPYDDIYRAYEFQESEKTGFIDNEFPYSGGPECPDKIICRLSYTKIINHLMDDVDNLKLISDRNEKYYALQVASYVAAILSHIRNNPYRLSDKIPKAELSRMANDFFDEYCSKESKQLDEICKKIRIGLMWDITIIVDVSHRRNDFDYDDIKEAPIGLTQEDYDKFENMSKWHSEENVLDEE